MARDAISEVDGPGKIRGRAVGVVGEASEEATNAADGDPNCEREGVEVAGGLAETDIALGQLDGEEAEGECADDRLTSKQVRRIVKVVPSELRVFQPEQKLRADRRSGNGDGDHGPAQWGGDWVAESVAKREVDAERDDVGERFEKYVGMDYVAAKVEIERKARPGMEREDHEEL